MRVVGKRFQDNQSQLSPPRTIRIKVKPNAKTRLLEEQPEGGCPSQLVHVHHLKIVLRRMSSDSAMPLETMPDTRRIATPNWGAATYRNFLMKTLRSFVVGLALIAAAVVAAQIFQIPSAS